MWCQFAQIWQLHIIAEDMTQMGISIMRHRQLTAFEHMRCQWEDLLNIAGIMERDTHAAGDDL